MRSIDRVKAAIAGEAVDRPPGGAWGHTYREEWSPEELAGVTIERARRHGWDFVKLQPRATFFAEAFGNRYHPSGHRLKGPVLDHAAVSSPEDWAELKLVNQSAFGDQIKALQLVVKELGPDVPVIQTVFSPMSAASYLVDRDSRRLIRELRQRPDLVLPGLEKIATALIDFSRRSVEAGAAGVFYAISHLATPDAMPRQVYGQLLLPLDEKVLSALPKEAWFNVLHLCGGRQTVEIARELPVQVLSYSRHGRGNPSLAEAQERSGKAVLGGVEQRKTLLAGPDEAVREQVREAVRETGGRRFLLGPGCSVPPRAKPERLDVMMQALAG
ncbi:MAG: uroporphyrinogen decarboxylase family protein [Candidatus Dormibacter sp.]|uniref:uroporphyrinogen decarboxylase family protein n=1 Tax=Candidatus Dormibacter sp. TaxID=2973982 RepID=UPI000DB211E5|nr:MAG: hypothetical protein DLM66_07110 [Candidatus Dormibacteraeota bacterium]